MNNSGKNPFENHFHIEEAKVDDGLLLMERGERHILAKAFFDYSHAVDLEHGRDMEVVEVKKEKSVVLPGSVRNRSKVAFAGVRPIFALLDAHNNLITYVFEGCVIRVEYLGVKGEEKKVKYFKCL